MNTHTTTRNIGRAALVALLVAPLPLRAQYRGDDRDRYDTDAVRRRDAERRLFTWRGTVDDDTRIYIRGGRIETRILSGGTPRREAKVRRDHALPRRDGVVRVQLLEGRGRVQVIQQPEARNGYTAIVRIKDARAGADGYRLAAYFDPWDEHGMPDHARYPGSIGDDVVAGARVFRWSGSVDGDLRITLGGGAMSYTVRSGEQPRGISSSGAPRLPRRDGLLAVALRQGRGSVQVLQQPSAFNDYTVVVRVLDPAGGFGYYDFDLIWR